MDTGGSNKLQGSDSQDSDDLLPPGTTSYDRPVFSLAPKTVKAKNVPPTPRGVEHAKKRLRAFSIQKKTSLSPVSVPKPISTGSATVFIGKAAGVKTQPKPEPDPMTDPKKLPKPPKPGAKLPGQPESYILTQKKTLAEIEDMKRKMELVDLGIPLGLICPEPNSDKAMPTKAMPPIKTFLNSDKVDELIREAKQAREEGREFKFDYNKLLPDYANPFQRNKGMQDYKELPEAPKPDEIQYRKGREKINKRRNSKLFDVRRLSSFKDRQREDKLKDKSSDRDEKVKERDRSKDAGTKYKDKGSKSEDKDLKTIDNKSKDLKTIDNKSKESGNKKEEPEKGVAKDEKEAEVDLTDFVVCDSWSDNEEKSKDSPPKVEEAKRRMEEPIKETIPVVSIDPMEQLRVSLVKKDKQVESTKPKLKRLNPVDSFKFEIEEPEEDILDMFDESYGLDMYSKAKKKELDSPDMQLFDYDDVKEATFDGMADDTFLEAVINEIKQEEIDETSQDKGLVEYDESPSKDEEARGSVTPEMDDRVKQLHSSRSDYSDGFKSTESGYKSTESLKASEYKSDIELEIIVDEKKRELERIVGEREINKYTADSLETWNFVLKICQPLLFRHDRNKCYKETRIVPKIWYTENPKLCNCVKDRRVVYEELEMCKMELVDSLYSNKEVSPLPPAPSRGWFPPLPRWGGAAPAPSEWETEDSQPPATPEPSGEMSLDKEYQRFMQAVWPEVAEPKSETPRSTPVRRDKKKADDELNAEKKPKKPKTGSEGWSQESDVEEEVKPTRETSAGKKVKVEKPKRKRKRSSSTSLTDSSESDAKKRKKMRKKKDTKKSKSKETRRRRVSKKNVKKLKDKPKKKKKDIEIDEDSDLQELEKEKKKKDKKIKKKKLLKLKKKNQKKKKAKAKSSSSSDSSSESEPEPERKSKKKKKSAQKKKKRETSYESQEELFDVNVLKNIKTERETDEEIPKQLEFSSRRQKPREIINVKELQNDFVGNSIQIKKEVEQVEKKNKEDSWDSAEVGVVEKQQESQESQTGSIKGKEEQEESQSTPQLPPDESNHSQGSSQESIYSLKDQPIYEKDESHLRPSSQNSNYSFHDVMASGMYTKSMEHAKQKNLQRLELEMQSDSHEHVMPRQEHDSRSRDRDIQRQEHDSRSRDRDIQRQEHDSRSRDRDTQRQEHDSRSRDRDNQRQEHDSRSRERDVQRQEHDMQRRQHDVQSRKHDMFRHEHDMSQEHEIHSQEHDMQGQEQGMQTSEHEMQRRDHEMQSHEHDMQRDENDMDGREYEQGNYEMYEQMAMAYQSDVANQLTSPPGGVSQRIETLVRARPRGEIKCDWRPGDGTAPAAAPRATPSRWGLKPGDVNIVLTGGEPRRADPVYRIQSLANRTETSATDYDEAYMDMYGAADKLQYGDCFSTEERAGGGAPGGGARGAGPLSSSLDARINLALGTDAMDEASQDLTETDKKDEPDKGILVTKYPETRGGKRVSFADGYLPGQDSDVEEPPLKKKRKARRLGCAWPCPAAHPDHVALWDALPPPLPPPGSPPPPAPARAPPAHLLRRARAPRDLLPPPHAAAKFDPNSMPAFMPPEPPPGLISFQSL